MTDIFPYLGIETSTDTVIEGEETASVPDISGTDIYEAISLIQKEGFNYNILGNGIKVSDQYPPAESEWSKSGTVTIYTATDSPKDLIEVPELLGRTVEEAKQLVGDHFTLQGGQTGVIQSQIPSAGCKIEKNNKIIIQTTE